jgi:ferritin
MSDKSGVQQSANKEKLESLRSQFKEIVDKREEVTEELNKLTTIAVKLQGAIEAFESMEKESEKKEGK